MKLFSPPLIGALVAILASVSTGSFVIWQAGVKIAAHAKPVEKPEAPPVEVWNAWTVEIDNLAAELKAEKERVRASSDQLDQRAAQLAAQQAELDKVRSELAGLRREIDGRVTEISAEEARNLRSLAQTYSALTPRAAVAILRELDDTSIIKILALMKPDVVSPIFEEMSRTPDGDSTLARRAAALSQKLRTIKPPKASTP